MSTRKVCVIGCDKKGIRAAIILSECGHRVVLVDNDENALSKLSKGDLPFHEPETARAILKMILKRRISLSNEITESVSIADFIFIATQANLLKSGAVNLSGIKEIAKIVGSSLRKGSNVVFLSKIPPGTTESVIYDTLERNSRLKPNRDFSLTVCKITPSKIVIGAARKKAGADIISLFKGSKLEKAILEIRTAETFEYLTGCIEAGKISCANELANLCELFRIDAREALGALGNDAEKNIGLGYGSSELISDISSMIFVGEQSHLRLELLRAVEKINDRQAFRAIDMLKNEIGNLKGKNIALLGLASDSGTTDVKGSKAFDIAIELLAQGAKVTGYDPLAISEFIKLLPGISYASSAREALLDADGCIIQTSDLEFSRLNKQDFDLMRNKTVIDGRRILVPVRMEKFGVAYRAVGLGNWKKKED